MKIMKAVLPVFLLCLILPLTAQERVSFPGNLEYDPFYAVQVEDSDGNNYTLNNASYLSPEGENKYFVWFRRGTDRGLAEYPLDLYKVSRFELTGNYEVYPDGYTPCRVELSSGDSFDGFLDTSGYLGGMDPDFGVYARIYLQYNGVKSVEFLHDGTYMRCPFCGALFYDDGIIECPFDRTPLESQN
ncbi:MULTISPECIES: hypothetical protein [unclassified Oceanispirochaeta]|uniref:hypothetical protein n=1 Tax=unclassified Oceanispirochaeta TaxID=2635722 RepID=UPI000E095EDA|nr:MULTISPECIES: hypothetical protein [unclassified Oceanispirochaeta]MBF9017039.1 hypothetical protein [Oceanispirochaeta sp. M2]NPD73488.1 hypothetical protein [Oceanispirochaeta sp. M1]RDG30779.1 hypothetical protein DV872_15435 [Oceanispirochaeta sp. M1]